MSTHPVRTLSVFKAASYLASLAAGYLAGSHFSQSSSPPAATTPAGATAKSAAPSASETNSVANGGDTEHTGIRPARLEPEFPAPKTFHEIDAALQSTGKSPAEKRLFLMETIGRLKPEELSALLAAEAANPDFFRRMRFDFQFTARRLAELAPEKAAALWSETPSLRFQSEALLGAWVRKDPQAFSAWALSLPKDTQRAAASTLGEIAAAEPEQFAALAPQIANTPGAATAARRAMETMTSGVGARDPAAAVAYAKSLPEGTMRNAALAQLARLPGVDLSQQPEIVGAIQALPREDAARLGRDLEEQSRRDSLSPQATKDMLSALPPGPALESALASNFRRDADRDATQAAARLELMKGQSSYPAAVRGFVEATAAKDPAAAADWALSIDATAGESARAQRTAALERVAREFAERSPEEARKWIDSAPLTEREYFILSGKDRAK
jgi:hypothetical protein